MKKSLFTLFLSIMIFAISLSMPVYALPDASIMPITEVPLTYTNVIHIKTVYKENGVIKIKGFKAKFSQPNAEKMGKWHEIDDFPDSFQIIDQGDEMIFTIDKDAKFYFDSINEKKDVKNQLLGSFEELKTKVEKDYYPAWVAEYNNEKIVKLTSLPLKIRHSYEITEFYTVENKNYIVCSPQIVTEYPSIEDGKTFRAVSKRRYILELAPDATLKIQYYFSENREKNDYVGVIGASMSCSEMCL